MSIVSLSLFDSMGNFEFETLNEKLRLVRLDTHGGSGPDNRHERLGYRSPRFGGVLSATQPIFAFSK